MPYVPSLSRIMSLGVLWMLGCAHAHLDRGGDRAELAASHASGCRWWDVGCHAKKHVFQSKVHCGISSWSFFSACTQTCGGGTQSRTRSVHTHPAHGGHACPHLTEERPCNANPCPIDCVAAEWGGFGECSETCGDGTKSRSRGVQVHAAHGGKPCPALTESNDCRIKSCHACPQFEDWATSESLGRVNFYHEGMRNAHNYDKSKLATLASNVTGTKLCVGQSLRGNDPENEKKWCISNNEAESSGVDIDDFLILTHSSTTNAGTESKECRGWWDIGCHAESFKNVVINTATSAITVTDLTLNKAQSRHETLRNGGHALFSWGSRRIGCAHTISMPEGPFGVVNVGAHKCRDDDETDKVAGKGFLKAFYLKLTVCPDCIPSSSMACASQCKVEKVVFHCQWWCKDGICGFRKLGFRKNYVFENCKQMQTQFVAMTV